MEIPPFIYHHAVLQKILHFSKKKFMANPENNAKKQCCRVQIERNKFEGVLEYDKNL